MKKTFPAVIAALLITICLAGGMFAVGGKSFLNSASAAPAPTQAVSAQGLPVDQSQAALIAEYQARETQYQAQITDAANQITAANQQIALANQQIQQYQSLVSNLQNSGLITVGSDGTVTINQQQQGLFSFFGGDDQGGNGEHH